MTGARAGSWTRIIPVQVIVVKAIVVVSSFRINASNIATAIAPAVVCSCRRTTQTRAWVNRQSPTETQHNAFEKLAHHCLDATLVAANRLSHPPHITDTRSSSWLPFNFTAISCRNQTATIRVQLLRLASSTSQLSTRSVCSTHTT